MFNTSKISTLTGATGADGATGPTGADGPQGAAGSDGAPGADGDDYDLTADQAWTGSQRATPVPANAGTFDLDGAQNFTCTPPDTFVLNFTAASSGPLSSTQAGQSGFIKLVNGGYTMTLNAVCKSDTTSTTGFIDTISGESATFLVSYLCDGTNVYLSTTKALA